MDYKTFIDSKSRITESHGFEISAENLHPNLFDFQRDIVRWALAKGRAAIFADCGLGKTLMQLSWAYEVSQHEEKTRSNLSPSGSFCTDSGRRAALRHICSALWSDLHSASFWICMKRGLIFCQNLLDFAYCILLSVICCCALALRFLTAVDCRSSDGLVSERIITDYRRALFQSQNRL